MEIYLKAHYFSEDQNVQYQFSKESAHPEISKFVCLLIYLFFNFLKRMKQLLNCGSYICFLGHVTKL